MKRNILILSGFWPKKNNPITGIFVVQQVLAFANLGHKVTVLVNRAVGRAASPFLSAEELGLPSLQVTIVVIHTIRLPEVLSSSISGLRINSVLAGVMYSKKIVTVNREYGPFDGCIVHGIRYAGLSIPKWAYLFPSGVIQVIHGVDPVLNKISNTQSGSRLLSACSAASKAIVLVGRPLLKHASALGVPACKQLVISNGTDIPTIKGKNANKNLENTPVRLISVSNLIELKGVDLNIKALSIVSRRRPDLSYEYVVVGDGPELARLKGLSKRLGLDNRVVFFGRLPYQATMKEVEKADVFSLPSWGEAFGIVYLEAMARYKPVIGCYDNGAEDIFEDGKQGFLVKPKDVNSLAYALEVLIDDERLRFNMGRKGRETSEGYTWEVNAQRMLDVFDSV